MTRDEILKACCSPTATRYNLAEPFIQGKWVYATDGHIAMRTAVWDGCELKKQPTPPVATVFREPVGSPILLPEIGDDMETEACEKCGGAGDHECSCGHSHDCEACDGTGEQPTEEELTPVDVGPVTLARVYIRLLHRIGVDEVFATGDKMLHPAYFKVGESEGVLMQCANRKRGDSIAGGRVARAAIAAAEGKTP